MRTKNLASGWREGEKKRVTYWLESDCQSITTKVNSADLSMGLTFRAQTPNGKVHYVVSWGLVGRINVHILASIGAEHSAGSFE